MKVELEPSSEKSLFRSYSNRADRKALVDPSTTRYAPLPELVPRLHPPPALPGILSPGRGRTRDELRRLLCDMVLLLLANLLRLSCLVSLVMVHRVALPRGRLQEPRTVLHPLRSTIGISVQPRLSPGLPPLPPHHRGPDPVADATARNHGETPASPAGLERSRERSRDGLEFHPDFSRRSSFILELGPVCDSRGRLDRLPDALPSRP